MIHYYKKNVASENHCPKHFSSRKLKRMALRKAGNTTDAELEYEKLVKNLKKGFKI